MGNKTSKSQDSQPEPENKTPNVEGVRNEIETTVHYFIQNPDIEKEIHDLINNPYKILPESDPHRDLIKTALLETAAFGIGVGVGVTTAVYHGKHAAKLLGKGMIKLFSTAHTTAPAVSVGIWALGAVNLLAAGTQIYKMIELYNKLKDNYKEITAIKQLLADTSETISKMLANCTAENYQNIELSEIDTLVENVEKTCVKITELIDDLKLKQSILKGISIGSGILAVLSLAAAGVLFATGVGAIAAVGFLFGAAAICGLTTASTVAINHFYFAREIEKQVLEFRKLRQELIKVGALLKIIRNSVRLHKFGKEEFKKYFKEKGMSKWSDCDKILDVLDQNDLLDAELMLTNSIEGDIKQNLEQVQGLSKSKITIVCKYVKQYQDEVEKAKEAVRKLTPNE